MMPDGIAFVLTSSDERGGGLSAKRRFPVAHRTREENSNTSLASPGSRSADVSVELHQRMRSGPACDLMRRTPATMSGPRPSNGPHSRLAGRCVTTYFFAAFRRSAIGPLGAFGQKSDHIS